jgi:hypothetical protein
LDTKTSGQAVCIAGFSGCSGFSGVAILACGASLTAGARYSVADRSGGCDFRVREYAVAVRILAGVKQYVATCAALTELYVIDTPEGAGPIAAASSHDEQA